MKPTHKKPTLVHALLGRSRPICTDTAEVERAVMLPLSLTELGLFQDRLSIRLDERGCVQASASMSGPTMTLDLCCGNGSSGSVSGDCPTIERSQSCLGRLGGPWFQSKTKWLEVVSITPSQTTIADGDIVSFAVVWQLRDDATEDSVRAESCACAGQEELGVGCETDYWITSLLVAVNFISVSHPTPACVRRGETYTTTWTFEFRIPCVPVSGQRASLDLLIGYNSAGVFQSPGMVASIEFTFDGNPIFTCSGNVPPYEAIGCGCDSGSGSGSSSSVSGSVSGSSTSDPPDPID